MPAGAEFRPLSILLLCDDWKGHANTILDHLAAFSRFSRHRVWIYNPRGARRSHFLDLDEFDVVVIHYSLCVLFKEYLPPDLRRKLRQFGGLKIQFIQDDYRWVDALTAVMRDIGIHVLYTLVPEPEIPKIWDESRLPGVLKVNTLAGYVAESLVERRVPEFEARPLDIGYRGRVLPYWLGRIGQEKALIAQGVLARADRWGLKVDLGWREGDRIYGRSWVDFISSCKATLGTESGATITDFDGSIERSVKTYIADHPQADFEEIHREVLARFEGNVRMNVISPRIFEAVALRTGLILFPGEYSGVLRARDHYLTLERDFSNLGEVAAKLCDPDVMRAMIERAYEEVALSGRYSLRGFIEQFDALVGRLGRPHGRATKVAHRIARAERWLRPGELWDKSGVPVLVRAAVRGYLTVRLALSDPDLRACTLWYGTRPVLWREASPLAVAMDLLRLGLLRYVQWRGLLDVGYVRITSAWRPGDDHLTFVSRKVDAWARDDSGRAVAPPEAPLDTTLQEAIRSGHVRKVSWNHAVVGTTVPYDGTRSLWAVVGLGDSGVYEFAALETFARRYPERLASALARAFRSDPFDVAAGFSGQFARRVWIRNRALWRLLRAARNGRGAAVERDVLRFQALWEIQKGRRVTYERFRIVPAFDREQRRLSLVSHPVGEQERDIPGRLFDEASARASSPMIRATLAEGRLEAIEWDHSALGTFITYKWARQQWYQVSTGSSGRWRFDSLIEVLNAHPDEAWQVLRPIVEGQV